MGEAQDARYWCHMCSQMVNPVMEDEMKCPFCESGFVEKIDSRREEDTDLSPDRTFSLWAPALLGMMGGPQRQSSQREAEEDNHGESEEEGEALDARYWCHMCSQVVNPAMEAEIKCPFCGSGYVEEMDSRRDS